ncbi:hypothetical protein GGTG_08536 [Gaeumannomyces tritici R3-111a-1]|uniref:ABC transporter domain-containing protein n=1 Tax=Gaeumannomyces tritici (strain R3-111a-1) TaxID=644352 RepID=J3P4V0_GAET3|nr:hypothetical protein GGTG_08536 [Gaeumannomyces tritici R3-111a-1]EJT74698.1 hypothetical protein GGTG_08536 [Gaeumannomyces tritici R3-111a-1]
MASESVATIQVSCKQTRFHIEASPNYRELDIEGLNITVAAPPSQAGTAATTAKGKAKKTKGEGLELLSNAKLRLKAGQRYALVGRNGSGKSTLLKAISEKLIPGIPEATRVSILQQTDADRDGGDGDAPPTAAGAQQGSSSSSSAASVPPSASALEYVVERATSKNELERDISALSSGVNECASAHGALRALRKLKHDRLQKRLRRSLPRSHCAFFFFFSLSKSTSPSRARSKKHILPPLHPTRSINQADDDIAPEALQAETQEAVDMLAELQLQVEPARLAEVEARARKMLAGLGFKPEMLEKPFSSLSGGWRMRASLAACLLHDTDILILDEPTNFLDLLGIVWLQRYLGSLEEGGETAAGITEPPTLILVSHDRDFISLCTDVLVVKDKQLTYHHGDLASYESSTAERRVHLRRVKEAKDKQKAHMQDTIARNLREGRRGGDDARVRQAKSRQRKLDERWGVEVSAKGTRFKLNRDMVGWFDSKREDVEVPPEDRAVVVVLPDPPELRFPGALISLEGASFRYRGAQKKQQVQLPLVLQDVTLSVGMGDRVGIVGLNGSGKSTLIKLLVEDHRPTSGTAARHPRLRLGYYSQHAVQELQALGLAEPELTALSLMLRETGAGDHPEPGSNGSGGDAAVKMSEGEVRALLGSLGLPGRLASDVAVRRLSGGQLVRLGLARILWRRPQCLVLDEPTTHLDYETVSALREALRRWAGAVVLVSHDRWFVRGVVQGAAALEPGEDGGDGGGPGGGRRGRER